MELDVIDRAAPDQDIAAASVIAGDEAASINIPYMTPPVGLAEHPLNVQPRQGHYSGDSHDSSSKKFNTFFKFLSFNIIIQFQKGTQVSVFGNHYQGL